MKSTMRPSVALLACACAMLASCAHRIQYALDEEVSPSAAHIAGTVKVETFKDQAPREEKINVSMGEDAWRVTGREGYPKGQIAPGVSAMVARHLDHSGLFDGVAGPDSQLETDYTLSGIIYDYNATGKVQSRAENTILMSTGLASLIGTGAAMAATEDVTTEVSSTVDLRDIQLKETKSGDVVFELERVSSKSSEEDVHFLEADPPKLYKRADRELRDTVEQLVSALESSSLAEEEASGSSPE